MPHFKFFHADAQPIDAGRTRLVFVANVINVIEDEVNVHELGAFNGEIDGFRAVYTCLCKTWLDNGYDVTDEEHERQQLADIRHRGANAQSVVEMKQVVDDLLACYTFSSDQLEDSWAYSVHAMFTQ